MDEGRNLLPCNELMIGRFRKSYLGVFAGLVLPSYRVVESGDVALIGYYMDGSATASPPTGDAFS